MQQDQVFLLLGGLESGSPGGVSLLRLCHAILCVGLSLIPVTEPPKLWDHPEEARKSVNFRTITPGQLINVP